MNAVLPEAEASFLYSSKYDMFDTAIMPGCPAHWPEWTEAYRLDDSQIASAYESIAPQLRAVIKTGLALAHMYFGEVTETRYDTVHNHHLGFWRATRMRPVPWAIVAFTARYAAAARLAAACVAAMLGGVPLVGAVCVGGTPTKEALVSLELSGVEDIFVLNAAQFEALLSTTVPAPGRLVLLHTGELDMVAEKFRAQGMLCFEERRMPLLALPEPDLFDNAAISFAQAEAYTSIRQNVMPEKADAVYLSPTKAHAACMDWASAPPLLLTPGCEGFWLHSGLTPSSFHVQTTAFGVL